MKTYNLALLDEFVSILNDEDETSDFAITKYLIENFNRLDDIGVNEIVDNAHVSRSSVRRYSQRLGYNNFSYLKEDISDIVFPSNIHLREFTGNPAYKDKLKTGLVSMFDDIASVLDYDVVEKLNTDINQHKKVIILSASNTTPNLIKFQQELLYAKKIVNIINIRKYENYLETIDTDDTIVIVVSVSGFFARSIIDEIKELDVTKYLLTVNRDEKTTQYYDNCIFLSTKHHPSDVEGLIGKYGITFFFDLLSENYISRFKK